MGQTLQQRRATRHAHPDTQNHILQQLLADKVSQLRRSIETTERRLERMRTELDHLTRTFS